ncbi:MAG: hypothetical protein M0Z84_05065, partial [Gammaproteobacteria bacterium]|nr:hypothetical protein [Gammaproteobacteria bacterium]
QDFPIQRHWYVAYPRGKQLSVVARAFLDYLLEAKRHFASLPTSASTASPRGKPRPRRSRARSARA